jgi:hypothetical protein
LPPETVNSLAPAKQAEDEADNEDEAEDEVMEDATQSDSQFKIKLFKMKFA